MTEKAKKDNLVKWIIQPQQAAEIIISW